MYDMCSARGRLDNPPDNKGEHEPSSDGLCVQCRLPRRPNCPTYQGTYVSLHQLTACGLRSEAAMLGVSMPRVPLSMPDRRKQCVTGHAIPAGIAGQIARKRA